MTYRKPRSYIPPYTYCDRWCERCAIDKTRCLVYQVEMDDRLHRAIEGRDEPTLDEVVERVSRDAAAALKMVEEQAREMGLDLGDVPAEAPSRKESSDPVADEGVALARTTADFLRAHAAEFPDEAAVLRWYHSMVGPKLVRAATPAEIEYEVADRILQAQVAHKALRRMSDAFASVRKKRPALVDELLDVLALIEKMTAAIERRWLSLPCRLLTPATQEEWWGPLRDVSESLRHLRRS